MCVCVEEEASATTSVFVALARKFFDERDKSRWEIESSCLWLGFWVLFAVMYMDCAEFRIL